MNNNDLVNELGVNFIEYAVAVNTDRAIPDAKSGLKPVAKRILYGAYDEGFTANKPHVKCANIVGKVMADWHPHGDSSIYGTLVRLSQNWTMRYPLIDFHGSNGNRDGDGPAAYRYTEARLSKLSEEGMLKGIKKKNVDFIPNYSETKDEPVTLPAIFPNLLCNPNTGIGVAMACNWLPHNLREVATAIYDYMDGKEPTLPGPDFPTGGIIINKKDLPNIVKKGQGSVKLRGKYHMEGNNIVFDEIPYGVSTEALMTEIGEACDEERITGIENIRNESNRKGFRLVIECEKGATIKRVINLLFKETNLQTSISYNQVALIDKTPTELTLKDCIKVYVDHNKECIVRSAQFDKAKAETKLEVTRGLLKALEDIDNIILIIKNSDNSDIAKHKLMLAYNLTWIQVEAIVNMKLGRLAGLERIEVANEEKELIETIKGLDLIIQNPLDTLRKELQSLVDTYGDDRRTEITQIESLGKEEEQLQFVEPEKCVVVMTEGGLIKRVPSSSFRTQHKNGKGVKTQDDITSCLIRTNTVDSLMIFSDKGKMYRLLVDNIPVGTNVSRGVPIKSLVEMDSLEKPSIIYSIYRDTDAKYVLFVTRNGLVKKTDLDEYIKTKKKTGIAAINIREGDSLSAVHLINDEDLMLITEKGICIKFSTAQIGATSRSTSGVKGISLSDGDKVATALPIRNKTDAVAIFSENGFCKKVSLKEFVTQNRAGKGIVCYKPSKSTGNIVGATLVEDSDNILVVGDSNSICVSASEIPLMGRTAVGNTVLKNNKVLSLSKV